MAARGRSSLASQRAGAAEPRLFEGGVLENRRVAEGLFEMVLVTPAGWGPPLPGQFVAVSLASPGRPDEAGGAVLRRPFSVAAYRASAGGARLSLLYAAVGRVTARMRVLAPGDTLACLGPLGTGFPLEVSGPAALVAGGRGLAPLLFLAEHLSHDGRAFAFLYGARTAWHMLPSARLAVGAHLATDDGSLGRAGPVVDLLDELPERPASLFACGPHAMLSAVAAWAARAGTRCWVSVETVFGCGTGLCGGCALPARAEPPRSLWACRDGPVLDAAEIDWDAWARAGCP